MTKLFYENIYMTDFNATVTDCSYDEERKQYRILLDRTAFFPEEGGQVADSGTINGQRVLDVSIKNDIIFHYVAEAIATGSTICGHVDFAQRFDFMQQHSGEHMISGLVHQHYGCDNVGFHLGLQEVTLDFNKELTLKQLREIEAEANAYIWQNLPIRITYPDSASLQTLSYRSKLDLTENVRIVEIPGVDTCACCAPHCETTGQIGLIKITNVQNHRGGVRVNILCGNRAVTDYTQKQNSITDISVLLSAKQSAVADAVKRLKEENLSLKEERNTLQTQILQHALQKLPAPSEAENAVLFIDFINEIAVRNTVNELASRYPGFSAVFAGNDSDGYRFIIGSGTLDCRNLAAALRRAFQAKGGGSAPMIQGTVHANRSALEEFLEAF